MTIKWSELVTTEAWVDVLEKILEEAEAAIQQNDAGKKLELQRLLKEFTKQSPPIPALDTLDGIARKTHDDLFVNIVEKSIEAIALRNAELGKAKDSISGAARELQNEQKASMIKNIIEALQKPKPLLDTLKTLEENRDNPDRALLKRIEALKNAISEFERA